MSTETDEDQEGVAAGWELVGGCVGGLGIKVILATSDYAGMCTPFGYQEFVFVDGVFAGTVALAPMGPRQDGALDISKSATISGTDTLSNAAFGRRIAGDTFCSSGRNGASYTVDRSGGAPVLLVAEEHPLPSRKLNTQYRTIVRGHGGVWRTIIADHPVPRDGKPKTRSYTAMTRQSEFNCRSPSERDRRSAEQSPS